MMYVIKSFEGPMSMCMNENNEKVYILCSDLPDGAKAGDCLFEDILGHICIDQVNTRINKKPLPDKE